MKVEDEIMEPKSYYYVDNMNYIIVFYFLKENITLDLSFMFQDIRQLERLSLNE